MSGIKEIEYFQKCYKEHFNSVLSFVIRYCRDRETAENITQDVFTVFWEKIEEIDKSQNPIFYLYRVAKNKTVNHIRHEVVAGNFSSYVKKREAEIAGKALDSLTLDEVKMDEVSTIVGRTLSSLNPKTAETFRLSRYAGMTNREIAKKMDVSIKTVEYRMMTALKILRSKLKDYIDFIIILLFV